MIAEVLGDSVKPILHHSKGEIARTAQQSAHLARLVIVVDGGLLHRLFADGASATLLDHHSVEVIDRQSVQTDVLSRPVVKLTLLFAVVARLRGSVASPALGRETALAHFRPLPVRDHVRRLVEGHRFAA